MPAALLAAWLSLVSCSPDPLAIPGPAGSVTRAETIAIAHAYSVLEWTPGPRHVRHGRDAAGVMVHTPDSGLAEHGFSNGWWKPGTPAKGMPYQWGGFDTPRQFVESLAKGESAGDISTAEKRRLGDAGTSPEACGIDCSGLVSRCWRLDRSVSTRDLPGISVPLKSWAHLKAGDILLNDKHVLLFKDWGDAGGRTLLCYEAGPFPMWRVNAACVSVSKLVREGYRPWRYGRIED